MLFMGVDLFEEFNNCFPDHIVVCLNERKVSSMSDAAVLADEFVLTHKNVYNQTKVEPSLLIASLKQFNLSGQIPLLAPQYAFIAISLDM